MTPAAPGSCSRPASWSTCCRSRIRRRCAPRECGRATGRRRSRRLAGADPRGARLRGGARIGAGAGAAAQCARGVVAASAGTHAQGVALAAAKLGIRATIVMPVTAPQVKVDAVRRFGGAMVEVVLSGDSYSEAQATAARLQAAQGATFVHPFDDPAVIAGQGTIALEILRQHPAALQTVFVPVGGGGLLAGVAACIKALRPEVRVIGVQEIG